MKLWRISQTENLGYDTWDSAVVAAATEEDAKAFHPYGDWDDSDKWWSGWTSSPEKVEAEYLGEAKPGTEPGFIVKSFNAG